MTSSYTCKVGDLVVPVHRNPRRGIVKEIHTGHPNAGLPPMASVFWLATGTIGTIDVADLRAITA